MQGAGVGGLACYHNETPDFGQEKVSVLVFGSLIEHKNAQHCLKAQYSIQILGRQMQ
jgi:hypothetical protein